MTFPLPLPLSLPLPLPSRLLSFGLGNVDGQTPTWMDRLQHEWTDSNMNGMALPTLSSSFSFLPPSLLSSVPDNRPGASSA